MGENSTLQSVLFGSGFGRPVVAVFDQPVSSSDAGALLFKPVDERLGLTRSLAGALVDERDPRRVRHAQIDLLRQRVFAMACGYEDANDASRLRVDPIQKLLVGRDPVTGAALASQPTISRFENGLTARSVHRLGASLAKAVITRHARRLRKRAERIIIDIDATFDEAHGQQQGVLFNGFYGAHGYLPLLAFLQFADESEQYLVSALLRPGTASSKVGVMSLLRNLISRVTKAFPKSELLLRADGGFATPELFDYLERRRVGFVIAMGGNSALQEFALPGLEKARLLSEASGESERVYADAQYQAKSWPHSRRAVIKTEVTRYPGREPRDNARYVITDLTGDAKSVYELVYNRRGDVENRIKELKDALRMDRTSCSSFLTNQARVIMHAAAFVLYQDLRLHAAGTSLARAQVTTLRERLIKLGGWIKRSTRRIVIHLPQDAPWRKEWITIANSLLAPPG